MRRARLRHAPQDSPAHQALLQAAAAAGHDPDALRELLRLLNAHDALVAHAQVMAHLVGWLDAFAAEQFGSPAPWGAWAQNIAAWRAVAAWIAASAGTLARQHDALALLDAPPSGPGKHPMLYRGVDDFPLVSALWNRHETLSPPLAPQQASPGSAAWRYWRLQGQLLLGCWRVRAQDPVRLRTYDAYKEDGEHLGDVLSSRDAARAVREWSHAAHEAVLAWLEPERDHLDFVEHVVGLEVPDGATPQTRLYLTYLKRYFERVRGATKPRQRRPRGSPTAPGEARRVPVPGFIGWLDPALRLVRRRPPRVDPDDPDAAELIYWMGDASEEGDEGGDVDAQEREGLAPGDVWEPLVEWIDPDAYAQHLRQAAWGSAARQTAAQRLPWEWAVLTDGEIARLWEHLAQTVRPYAHRMRPHSASSAHYHRHAAALLLATVLVLGQPLERALRLYRWEWPVSGVPADFDALHDADAIGWCVRRATHPADDPASDPADETVGYALAAIAPPYRTVLHPELARLARPVRRAGQRYLLPPVGELGVWLAQWWRLRPLRHTDARLFHLELPTAQEAVQALLEPLEESRYTVARIERALPRRLLARSGDASRVWLTFAQRDEAAQPRLYYTQQPLRRLQRDYAEAARAMLGVTTAPFDASQWAARWGVLDGGVALGARFVIRRDELRQALHALRTTLEQTPPRTREAWQRYDDHYALYTFLMTALCTGVRTVARSVALWRAWHEWGCPSTPIRVGLADKEREIASRARLVALPGRLVRHYALHRRHLQAMQQRLAWRGEEGPPIEHSPYLEWPSAASRDPTARLRRCWHELVGAPVPLNFARALLRTELLERDVPAESIDAFLGHANHGEAAYMPLSSSDPVLLCGSVSAALDALLDALDLQPVRSRLAGACP